MSAGSKITGRLAAQAINLIHVVRCLAVFVLVCAIATPAGSQTLSVEQLRPRPELLLDCKDASPNAVTRLPADLARWATIYCTKQGHILTFADGFFGNLLGTPYPFVVRAKIGDADQSGRGHEAYFEGVEYRPVALDDVLALRGQSQWLDGAIEAKKPLYRLRFSSHEGGKSSMIVIDPSSDPFFLIPLRDNGQPTKFVFVMTSVERIKAMQAQSGTVPR